MTKFYLAASTNPFSKMTITTGNETSSPSASPEDFLHSIVNRTTIQNRRLTYLNRTNYVEDPAVQERLFPLLYEKLILNHQTRTEKDAAANASKSRSLTHVLLDAQDHMDKLEHRRDRTDEERQRDEEREENERMIGEATPKAVLADRDQSRLYLERMVREKFLNGGDEDFDYAAVDEDEEWDDWETLEEDLRAKYFDSESPDEEAEGKVLKGETGVQDF
jgi:hypothetical protein